VAFHTCFSRQISRKVKRRDAALRLHHAPNSPRGTTHRHASLARVFAHRSGSNTMVAASGPRVAKGIFALLAIALGAASGETLAPFPGTEPAIASCRAEAHRSVFELEARASSGAPGTAPPSVCARVVSNPGMRCVIAAASTRCRLARAEVRARGACDETRADKCEACVLRALAGAGVSTPSASGHAYVTRESSLPLEKTFETTLETTRVRGHYTIPPAMEWQVYLAELDAVARECARAEDAWRADAAAAALARVMEQARDFERAAETRDAAARQTAAAVLAEVEAARTAAADASRRLGVLETQVVNSAASLSAWRDDAEAFAKAHGETMRVIEKQSDLIRGFSKSVGSLTAFAQTHTHAVWRVVEFIKRDARATREALDALAASKKKKDAFFFSRKDVIVDVFIRAFVVAPWRLARLAVRSSLFAWRVVMLINLVLARVVPARYRVAAGLAAAVAARRASRARRDRNAAFLKNASGHSRDDAEARLGLDCCAVLRELRALRRETAERALFEPEARARLPRRKGAARRGALEHETAAEEKEVWNASERVAEEEETIGATTTRATRATTRARNKIQRGG